LINLQKLIIDVDKIFKEGNSTYLWPTFIKAFGKLREAEWYSYGSKVDELTDSRCDN